MKRGLLALCLLVLMTAPTVTAEPAAKLGVGVFAGISVPVVQDDQASGSEFGVRVRYGLGSIIVLEPFASFVKWGDPGAVDLDGGGTFDMGISGSKLTSFGLEATLGNAPGTQGLAPFFFAGLGSYKVENDDTGYDESALGWSGGLGLGIGLSPKLGLDFRAKVLVAPQDGGSKKAFGFTGGINFNFGGGDSDE